MYQKAAKGWLKHFDFLIVDAASLQTALFLADLGYGDGQDLAVYGILVINFCWYSWSQCCSGSRTRTF